MINPESLAGLYIHLPFCHKICPFCTFPTVKDQPQFHQQYTDLLGIEIQLNQQLAVNSKVSSVYFGGGTPSRLALTRVEQIKNQVLQSFPSAAQAEWTFELNPEDCNPNYCLGLFKLGFQRLSLGVQSFQDACLKKLGRVHNAQQAFEAIEAIQIAGFKNFNLDFLYGYQNRKDFNKDLQTFCVINPPHLSAYCLEIDHRSRLPKSFTQWQNENQQPIQTQYTDLVQNLESVGLQQYELSNFAKPGFESEQNLVVWRRKNYLGLGLGSHSFIGQQRFWNTDHMNTWQTALQNRKRPIATFEQLSLEQTIDEIILVNLRLKQGLDLNQLYQLKKLDYQAIWQNWLTTLEKHGWLTCTGGKLCLMGPGLLHAADIAADLCNALQPYLEQTTLEKTTFKRLNAKTNIAL